MPYLLNELEEMICTICNDDVCIINKNIHTKFDCDQKINVISSQIKDQLLTETAALCNLKKSTVIIRFYQSSLIRLMDYIHSLGVTICEREKCNYDCLSLIIWRIEELLIFIIDQFPSHIDLSFAMPQMFYEKERVKIRDRLSVIKGKHLYGSLSCSLRRTIVHPIEDYIKGVGSSYTFYDKHYLYAWLERLENPTTLTESMEEDYPFFCKELLAFNINSEQCITFFIEYIKEKYSCETSIDNQQMVLHYFEKCCQQSIVVNEQGYHPNKPALKYILLKWIKHELKFIKKYTNASESFASNLSNDIDIVKSKTNLSVSQLACFIRVCVESGIFPRERKKELLLVVANNFSTSHQTNISINSLSNQFYTVDKSAMDFIKNVVFKQVKLIQENKI